MLILVIELKTSDIIVHCSLTIHQKTARKVVNKKEKSMIVIHLSLDKITAFTTSRGNWSVVRSYTK